VDPSPALPPRPPSARSARPPLAAWLFASVLGAIMAAVATCTLVSESFVREEARREAVQFLQINADELRDALDRGMAQNFEDVRVLAGLDPIAASTDPEAVRRALDQVHASFPQFAWLGLTGRDGKVVAATGGLLEGADVSRRSWFTGAQRDMYVGDVHNAVLLARLLPARAEPWRFVDIAAPVRGPDGRVTGVLGGHLSWEWAGQIKREIVDPELVVHSAEALIVGADGVVLLGPAGLQGHRMRSFDPASEFSVESRTRGWDRSPGLGWRVVLHQPEPVAMATFHTLQWRVRIAAALLCVVLAPLSWLLARRLAAPLRELGAELETAGSAVPPARRPPLYREAELLGLALDRHARRQQEDAARLRDLNAGLEARVAERTAALERANDELAQAVRERLESEERLRDILTHAPDAYIAIDEAGRIAEWNRRAEQTLGWTRDEALGHLLAELVMPPDPSGVLRTGADAFTGGDAAAADHRVERSVRHKSGAEIPVQLSAASLPTERGQVAYAFMHDISERKRAERRLAHSERRLRTVTDNMPALVSHIDTEGRYSFTNATYGRWFGVDHERLVGRPVREVVGERAFRHVEASIQRALAGEACSVECEVEILGRPMHNLIHYVPDRDEDGVVQGLYGMVLDLTERRAVEVALARSEQRLRTITDNLPVLISYVDREERYQFCNGTYRDWLGQAPEQVVGRTVEDMLGAQAYAARRPMIQRALAGEHVEFDSEISMAGVHRHLHMNYLPDTGPDGRTAGFYVLVTDVSAMKLAEQRLTLQVRTDALTGLPNRVAFDEKLAEALARSRRSALPVALFFLDIDKFKTINDSMGHAAGDQVLAIFARRLRQGVREVDTVARLAGDEFVVILEGLHTPFDPQTIAGKILASMAAQPFVVDGRELAVTASIGIAYQPDGRAQPAELLARADHALYESKAAGRGTFRVSSPVS
jgi:diguanylate cyclase (GGDEF)-like protein/PAS domain S-box-containing protein